MKNTSCPGGYVTVVPDGFSANIHWESGSGYRRELSIQLFSTILELRGACRGTTVASWA